ncbi:hypothetical protein RUM44_013498 [Polyplax serrata]|uniref:Uncharacterized protein n=1 Tax=Polyplax serrata TaxID=468196 RepID=A0ABR1BJ24_POLSC
MQTLQRATPLDKGNKSVGSLKFWLDASARTTRSHPFFLKKGDKITEKHLKNKQSLKNVPPVTVSDCGGQHVDIPVAWCSLTSFIPSDETLDFREYTGHTGVMDGGSQLVDGNLPVPKVSVQHPAQATG